jgi:hypothetical protein
MSSGEVGDKKSTGWAVPSRAVRAGLKAAARSASAPAHALLFMAGHTLMGVIPFSFGTLLATLPLF